MTSKTRYTVWGVSIIFIGFIIWAMVVAVKSGVNNMATAQGELTTEVSTSDWSEGSASSTVTIVEYSDFQCPACAAYHPVIKKLLAEKGSQFKFVYRHYPLVTIHMNAALAAQASEAAGKQGKFWEMHDKLFTNQNEWAASRDVIATFTRYAQEIGLNVETFTSDINNATVRQNIADDYKSGRDSGVQGTPTFFVNGKQIQNPGSYEAFAALIDSYYTNSNATSTAQ